MVNKDKVLNNKNVVSLLIFLALILIITSSIVCYIIGKNSGISGSGKIIDTIIIEEPQNTDKLPVYLTGKVLYKDGTPYQGTIRMFSKMQETKTDKNGTFLFKNVIYGKHTIVVLDNNGKVVSEMPLTINQSTMTDKITIKKKTNGYEISVGINIALIEVSLKFDKDKKSIDLDEQKITVVNYEGKVITPEKITSIKNSIFETFGGSKVMPEGIVVLPNRGVILSNGTFISSAGQISYSEGETSLPKGIKVEKNGTITLSDKTIIKSDGTIVRPANEETKPVTGDDEEEKDPLTWDAPIVKQGNMSWDQLTTLDLFATNDSTIDGKIYPGVSGEYEFSIENINPYSVLFSLEMKEQEHEAGSVNLSYRLKYYDETLNKYIYVIGDESTYLKPDELSNTEKVSLSSNTNITYILEWIWANENNREQDLKDGKIGISDNKVHYIDMKIYIENA